MEDAIQKSNRRLVIFVSGFIGILVGVYLPLLWYAAHAALWLGIFFWFAANAGIGTSWRPRVYYYGVVMVVFGAMAVIGIVLNWLLRF